MPAVDFSDLMVHLVEAGIRIDPGFPEFLGLYQSLLPQEVAVFH
jgi:hypothetical protein